MTPMQWVSQQGMQATFGIQPPKATHLNDSERLRIVRLHKQGMSQREIVDDGEVVSMSMAIVAQHLADARDAARYRWLRDITGGLADGPWVSIGDAFMNNGSDYISGGELDAAIDAAMQQESKPCDN